ncbi:hypothetical protein [Pedobacter sp. Leaf132]|uniref:hypothetical protein n=1 Tax=Pedobacter sp. Leaf132 TaxID=2876557 RepID=UPI001E3DB296|nr:hypothetical protein [Pedobacter sp. Leaf132]
MADKEFPKDYSRLSPVSGTEKIMAARASDGKMFWVTLADITAGFQAALVSGTTIKTINGISILGPGNIAITGGGSPTTNASALTSGTLDDARLSANVAKLETVGTEKVIAKNNLRAVILGPGVKEYTDNNSESSIQIDTAWLDSYASSKGWGSGGGNTTPAPPTLTANDSTDTLTASHALGTSEIVMSINDAAYVAYSPISVGNVARAAGYWKFKIKSATGRNESSVVSSPAFTVASGGGAFTPKTIFINLCSEYADGSVTNPPNANVLNATNSALGTVNGFTSPNLKDITGALTGITLTNSGAFSGGNSQISTAQDSAGNTGVYENAAVNTGWSVNGGTSAKINFLGLTAGKYYQLYFLMPMDNTVVRGVTINGTTKNRTSTSSAASFGAAANGLNDPELIVFNNLTSVTSIEAAINRVSGDYGATLALIVLQESDTAKP